MSITLGVKSMIAFFDGWIPEYVTIQRADTGILYKFIHNPPVEIEDASIQMWPLRKFVSHRSSVRNLCMKTYESCMTNYIPHIHKQLYY